MYHILLLISISNESLPWNSPWHFLDRLDWLLFMWALPSSNLWNGPKQVSFRNQTLFVLNFVRPVPLLKTMSHASPLVREQGGREETRGKGRKNTKSMEKGRTLLANSEHVRTTFESTATASHAARTNKQTNKRTNEQTNKQTIKVNEWINRASARLGHSQRYRVSTYYCHYSSLDKTLLSGRTTDMGRGDKDV